MTVSLSLAINFPEWKSLLDDDEHMTPMVVVAAMLPVVLLMMPNDPDSGGAGIDYGGGFSCGQKQAKREQRQHQQK